MTIFIIAMAALVIAVAAFFVGITSQNSDEFLIKMLGIIAVVGMVAVGFIVS